MNRASGSIVEAEPYARALPARGAMRWLRGGVVGLAASVLAWLGHWLSSGMQPGLESLMWVAGCSVLVGVALSGHRWRLPSLLTVLLGAQGAMHYCFSDMSSMHAAHGDMGASMSGAAAGHAGVLMVASHVVAALSTALLLRRGEDWCWSLVELLTRPLTMLAATGLVPTKPSRRAPLPPLARATTLLLLADSQSRRGPPCPVR